MRLHNGSTLAALFALALASSGTAHAQTQDSNFYYQRGLANVNGDQAQAFADFNEAIRLDPQNANAYVGRGSVRFDGGSMADYTEAIRLDPKHAAALADYDQAIRLRPDVAETWGQRAGTHWDSGNREQAFRDADEAIRLNPQDARLWLDRGLFSPALRQYGASRSRLCTGAPARPKLESPLQENAISVKQRLADTRGLNL